MEISQEYINENIDKVMNLWVMCNTKQGIAPSRSCKSKAKSKLMKDWTYDSALCMLYQQDSRITKIEKTLKHQNYKMNKKIEFLEDCSRHHSDQIAKLQDRAREEHDRGYLRISNLKRQIEDAGNHWQNDYYKEFKYPDKYF